MMEDLSPWVRSLNYIMFILNPCKHDSASGNGSYLAGKSTLDFVILSFNFDLLKALFIKLLGLGSEVL